MKHLLSKRSAIFSYFLIFLLSLLACQASPSGSATNTSATQEQGAVSTEPNEVIVQADIVFGPGVFNFPDTKAGLAELSSYQATMTLVFDGTHDGQIEQWSKTYSMLNIKEPAARQLSIEKTGDLSDLTAVLMAEKDGAAYRLRGGNTCNANVIDQENLLSIRLEPAGFLTGVIGAEEAGSEIVNNIASDHYTFDERAFGLSGLVKSTGEIWIASDGGFIVRYRLATVGNAGYFGEGIEGKITWDYELTDVNQLVVIALPEDCPAGMIDAPRLPDATDLVNVPSLVTYITTSTPPEAATFYLQQLPPLGWTPNSNPVESDTLAVQEFTRENQTLSVTIRVDEHGTKVLLVLRPVLP